MLQDASIAARCAFAAAGIACVVSIGCTSPRTDSALVPPPVAANDPTPVLELPARTPGAETGSAFFARVMKLGPVEYEQAVGQAVEQGNVPAFERKLARVELSGDVAGKPASVAIFVLPDYLAIGSDEDFVRVPMLAKTAQHIADKASALLPTPKLVDAIYKAAAQKFSPIALGAGPSIDDRTQFTHQNELVEQQRRDKGFALGPLSAGDKKDIIVTNQLVDHGDRVAIYGFQLEGGQPIQAVSIVHGIQYEDYSHGVRLVSQHAIANGAVKKLEDIYRDSALSALVSEEGPMKLVRYP